MFWAEATQARLRLRTNCRNAGFRNVTGILSMSLDHLVLVTSVIRNTMLQETPIQLQFYKVRW